MRYDQAHKYGWWDYLFDFMEKKPDVTLIIIGLAAFAIVLLLAKMGLIVF